MYKNGPGNVHDDVWPRFRTLAEAADDDWNEIPSFFIENPLLEHTDINHSANTALPHKLRYKHARLQCQLQCNDHPACNPTSIGDVAHDELFAILPAPTSADPMIEPISNEGMATAPFKNLFCIDIRRVLNKGYHPLMEKMKT